jgi:hypothetical protein
MDEEFMILVAETFFQSHTTNLTRQEIRDIVQLNRGTGQRVGGWPIGWARTQGLAILLVNPNKYPLYRDPDSLRFYTAICFFDNTICPHDRTRSWGQMKEYCIRLYYLLHDKLPLPEIANNEYVGKKYSNLPSRYSKLKNKFVSWILVAGAYGFNTTRSAKLKLCDMGKMQENLLVNNYFVRLQLKYFLEEMDPNNELDYGYIVTLNNCRSQEDFIGLCKHRGIFSDSVVGERCNLPNNHVRSYTIEDADVCKGIPYDFARVAALIVQGFDYPVDDQLNSWTNNERMDLYKPFDPEWCIPRYPPVNSRRPEEYGYYAADGTFVPPPHPYVVTYP